VLTLEAIVISPLEQANVIPLPAQKQDKGKAQMSILQSPVGVVDNDM
jgi:hypothetical protein